MKRLLISALAVSLFTTISTPVFASIADNVLPQLKENGAKNGLVENLKDEQYGLNVKVQGTKGTVGEFDWQNFNVGRNAHVNFEFTNHNQTALNRVDKLGGASEIYGRMTNSCGANCGYAGTSKVILLNPNGVIFGSGANVDLNSFTVSTFDGNYDSVNKTLTLTKGADSKGTISVLEGAEIKGDEGVNFAAGTVNLYKGSKISTGLGKNFNNGQASVGKVKLVTADGVTFNYYGSGAVRELSDVQVSEDKMTLQVNGEITAGNIDLRNYSTNAESQTNLYGAKLKAVKAEVGNDGNIWLTATNNVIVGDADISTENGGDVYFQSGRKITLADSNVNSSGNVNFYSSNYDVVVDNAKVNALGNVKVDAGGIASVQNNSVIDTSKAALNRGNVDVVSRNNRSQVLSSKVNANGNITVDSKQNNSYVQHSQISGSDVNIYAANGKVSITDNGTIQVKNNLNVDSKNEINESTLKNTSFMVTNDINLTSKENIKLAGIDKLLAVRGTINLKADKDIEIVNDGSVQGKEDLSFFLRDINFDAGENVKLAAKNGDVYMNGNYVKFKNAKNIDIEAGNDLTLKNESFGDAKVSLKAGEKLDYVNEKAADKRGNDLGILGNDNVKLSAKKGKFSYKNGDVNIESTDKINRSLNGIKEEIEFDAQGGNLTVKYLDFSGANTVTDGDETFNDQSNASAKRAVFNAKDDLTVEGLKGVTVREKGLIAHAGKNMSITTAENTDLAISELVSGGEMRLTLKEDEAGNTGSFLAGPQPKGEDGHGLHYFTNPGDADNDAYLEAGGKIVLKLGEKGNKGTILRNNGGETSSELKRQGNILGGKKDDKHDFLYSIKPELIEDTPVEPQQWHDAPQGGLDFQDYEDHYTCKDSQGNTYTVYDEPKTEEGRDFDYTIKKEQPNGEVYYYQDETLSEKEYEVYKNGKWYIGFPDEDLADDGWHENPGKGENFQDFEDHYTVDDSKGNTYTVFDEAKQESDFEYTITKEDKATGDTFYYKDDSLTEFIVKRQDGKILTPPVWAQNFIDNPDEGYYQYGDSYENKYTIYDEPQPNQDGPKFDYKAKKEQANGDTYYYTDDNMKEYRVHTSEDKWLIGSEVELED